MSEEQDGLSWDYSLNVQKALEDKEIVSLTCPLGREKSKYMMIYVPSVWLLAILRLVYTTVQYGMVMDITQIEDES